MKPFLKLPFQFDESLLKSDQAVCQHWHWQNHFNTNDYDGKWVSIALRSKSGQATEIFANPAEHSADYRDTDLLRSCSYFAEILKSFHCPLESVRLLNLKAGSHIKPHKDPGLCYAENAFRLHIPITTNDKVVFQVGEELAEMLPGECWYGDFNVIHSVANNGVTDRIHLIIDGVRNEWTNKVFDQAGYDFNEEEQLKQPAYSKEQLVMMIENLESLPHERPIEVIKQLKEQLQGFEQS
ncbi:MAG: aspartyl/asparaginyl beta-hydroxylase domain-containing protein [Bacteroidota bacterium]